MPDAPARPRQTTWSGWVILVGSLLVLATVVQTVMGIGSMETREGVEDFLDSPPGSGLGLGTEGALEVLRISAMVTAACAVTAAILGWQVLQRSRSARAVLSVLSVPLFVTGTITGGLLSAAVVAAIVTLWLQPSADWFAGRTPAPARLPAREGERRQAPAASTPSYPASPPVPAAAPVWPPPLGHPVPQPDPVRRPPALVWACVVAIVCSALVLLVGLLSLVVLWGSPDEVMATVREQDPSLAEQGIGLRELQVASSVVVGVLAVWSVAASVVAALALRGAVWARWTLLASAAVAGTFSLLAMLAAPAMAVLVVACGVTVALLLRPEVRGQR